MRAKLDENLPIEAPEFPRQQGWAYSVEVENLVLE